MIENPHRNAVTAKSIIRHMLGQIPRERSWPCHVASENALSTDKSFGQPKPTFLKRYPSA